MKRSLLFLFVIISLFALQSYRGAYIKRGESPLISGIKIVSLTDGIHMIAYYDSETGKIGFLSNDSNLTIKTLPIYEDSYYIGYKLIAVKKDGKWGAVDLGTRYNFGPDLREPIIPCKYRHIEIISDDVAICDGQRIDVSQKYAKW